MIRMLLTAQSFVLEVSQCIIIVFVGFIERFRLGGISYLLFASPASCYSLLLIINIIPKRLRFVCI